MRGWWGQFTNMSYYDDNDKIQHKSSYRHFDNGSIGAIMSTQQGVNALRASDVEAQRQVRRKAKQFGWTETPQLNYIWDITSTVPKTDL